MWIPKNLRFQRAVFWFVVFSAAGVTGFLVFMFSGVYNVAASVTHFDVTNRIIKVVLRRSVQTHSDAADIPELADEGMVRLGANHYRTGCAACHGSPAEAGSAVTARMYPAPPSLVHAREDWSTEDLHWIVRNGLKFTGMPAWPGEGRDDEVWPLVAFLEALPDMSASEYMALTDADGAKEGQVAADVGLEFGSDAPAAGSPEAIIATCASCHGDGGNAPVHGLVPAIGGQKEPYLRRSLEEYRANVRQSGIMEPVAHDLDDTTIRALAAYFADNAAVPFSGPEVPFDGDPVRGRAIALRGVPDERVAPCGSCHGAGRSEQFPRISGLSATYILTQLQLFHAGVRAASPYAEVMSTVAGHMDEQMMKDAAAFYASLPAGSEQPVRAATSQVRP